MPLVLINDTPARVHFRLRQHGGLSGTFTLDKGGRFTLRVDDQYRVRVFNDSPDVRYELPLDVLEGAAFRLSAFRRDDGQSPLFEVAREPPRQLRQLECENTTLLPLCFRVERLHPRMEALLTLPPQGTRSLTLQEGHELEAVLSGSQSHRLSLKSLNCTVHAFHDKETGKSGLRVG